MNKTFKVNRSGFEDSFMSLRFLPYVRFRSPTALESSVLGFRCVRVEFSSSGRVRRGGGWSYGAASCRTAYRFVYGPDNRVFVIGLRCVRREE